MDASFIYFQYYFYIKLLIFASVCAIMIFKGPRPIWRDTYMTREAKSTEIDMAGRIFTDVLDCVMIAVLDLMLFTGFIPSDCTAWTVAAFAAGFGTILFPYCLWRDAKACHGLQDQEEGE